MKRVRSRRSVGGALVVVVVLLVSVLLTGGDATATPTPTAHQYRRVRIVMDAWQGAGMAQRLRGQHLKVTDIGFTAELNDHLARTVIPLLRGRRLSLPRDEQLVDELVNVRVVEPRPGKYRIEHDADRHNDRTITIALAAQDLLNTPPPKMATLIV